MFTVRTQLLVRPHTTAAVDMEVGVMFVDSEDMIQQLPRICGAIKPHGATLKLRFTHRKPICELEIYTI